MTDKPDHLCPLANFNTQCLALLRQGGKVLLWLAIAAQWVKETDNLLAWRQLRPALMNLGRAENLIGCSLAKIGDYDRGRSDNVAQRLGSAQTVAQAIESGSQAGLALASIRRELSPQGMADVAWATAVYDGDLGDLPVFVVTPADMPEAEFQAAWETVPEYPGKSADAVRAKRLLGLNRNRYMATSTRSERIYAPAGTSHLFGYEAPEFVIDVVRRVLSKGRT